MKTSIPKLTCSVVKQEFPCQHVATTKLSGQIVPNELVRDSNSKLVVMYMAYWLYGFYGITDGFVIQFPLATVRPDADGMFQVELPYFSVDAAALPSQRRAGFQFTLYDRQDFESNET